MKTDNFRKALQRLVLNRPMYAAVVLQLNWKCDPEGKVCATVGVDGKNGWYNPAWFDGLSSEHRGSVLCHEGLHVILRHHLRRGKRDPQIWNEAGDFVINDILIQDGFSLPPGLHDPQYRGMDTETVYDKLTQNQPPPPPGGGGKPCDDGDDTGKGSGGQQGQGDQQKPDTQQGDPGQGDKPATGWGDVYDMPGKDGGAASEADLAEAEAELSGRMENILAIAKAQGDLPSGLQRLFAESLKPKHDWKSILRNFVVKEFRNDQTWTRPNKRFAWSGIILPSTLSEGLKEVVIGIDTSGSISTRELAEFEAEVNGILEDYPTEVTVMYCDSRVAGVDHFNSDELPIKFTPVGGGGTSFVPVFEEVEKRGIDPSVLIYFTDMYGTFPDSAPPYPVLWVDWGSKKTPPFGEHCVLSAHAT